MHSRIHALKVFRPDVASSVKVHIPTQRKLVGSILIGEYFVVSDIHGKPETQVFGEEKLG